jgi:hypothetical protein
MDSIGIISPIKEVGSTAVTDIALIRPSTDDSYADIVQILGKKTYENSDGEHCNKHIVVHHDSDLNENVFGFLIHVNEDDDRGRVCDR